MALNRTGSEHQGRVAIVTVGSSGIGAAITERLRSEGAHVTIVDVNRPAALDTSEAPTVGRIDFVRVDVAQEREVQEAFSAVAAREGKIDYLITCAAVFGRSVMFSGMIRASKPA